METLGADRNLGLILKLAGLSQDEFVEVLHGEIKKGYITKSEFERFVSVMHERLDSQERVSLERADAQDELLKLKVENVELKLKAEQREGFDRYIDERLPAAIAQHNANQRSNIVSFFRKRFLLIASILLAFTTAVSLWTTIQTSAELRDIKSVAKIANEINDALDP